MYQISINFQSVVLSGKCSYVSSQKKLFLVISKIRTIRKWNTSSNNDKITFAIISI